jgi:hypothetical protein
MNAVNYVYQKFQTGLGWCAFSAVKVEPLEKVSKIGYKFIDLVALIRGSISSPLELLSSRLKVASDMFESIRFFDSMKTLVCPNEKGVYFFQDKTVTWQKRADRVFLAAHTGLKMVNGANKFGLINLGMVAKYSIGHLPIFKLTYDSFIILSSFFGNWDAINSLPKAQKNLALANEKIDKWEYRETLIDLIRAQDQIEIDEVLQRYSAKASEAGQALDKLEVKAQKYSKKLKELAAQSDAPVTEKSIQEKEILWAKAQKVAAEFDKMAAVKQKAEGRIFKIAQKDYESLADELAQKDRDFKVRKWEARKDKAEVDQTKCWLKIASAIAKIAVVTLALVFTAINLWTLPAAIAVTALGLLSDSTGYVKILYENHRKPKPEPIFKPRAATAAV